MAVAHGPGVVIGSRCAWTLHNFRKALVDRLQSGGFRVVALGADLDGYEDRLRREGVDFRSMPVPLQGIAPLKDFALFLAFVRVLRRERPAVAHMFTIKPVIYGTLAAALVGVPRRVCTITGLGHAFTEGGWLVRTLAEFLYRLALARAHVVFFQNEDDRALFVSRRLLDPAKARLVPGSGVDLDRFSPTPKAAAAAPFRFLMIARLLREKGVLEFIEAAERLAAAGVPAEFRLLGAQDSRNPTRLSPQEMARLDASPVNWVGSREDVRPEIAEADVVVLPSYREGTPRVLLEAMAMAKPVVTTDAVGCRQLVKPGINGFMAPVRDAARLAEAMAACLQARDRLPAMGKASRAMVEADYSEQVVLDRFLASYEVQSAGAARS